MKSRKSTAFADDRRIKMLGLQDRKVISAVIKSDLNNTGLGCRFKANCPLVGPKPIRGFSTLESFGENH